MKNLRTKFLILSFLVPQFVFAHGESGTARIGKAFAVQEASEAKGIRLSENALKMIGVKTTNIDNAISVNIPKEALVYFQDSVGIYRLRDGFFKKIDLTKYKNSLSKLQHPELRSGDGLVVAGTALLRVSELEAFGSEEGEEEHGDEHGEEGHSHDESEKGEGEKHDH